ncbi:MAG: hypothetical protein APF81_14770 [Desulfosporosinus sp. BRH_c37]|nr:MAG: hypothetical protein APF81_14770 [Desulfosporosinus sp. BRH_c37]
MFITFPVDEKTKARLDAVCKSLNISLEEWFETYLKASEFDVLVKFLDNPEDQTSWMWDEKSCQFVRRSEAE